MTSVALSPLLPLQGGFNLRDMGGYATEDGRTVKHGMLFRSGVMSLLTDADEAYLVTLGIATVCDLRRPGERKRDPTRWCDAADTFYWSRDYSESSGVLGELLRGAVPTADHMRTMMINLYRQILVDHAPAYRFLFERLASGHAPLLFNCSAGKDRTGVGAALILAALGVPRAAIVEDYLLTNRFADFDRLLAAGRAGAERYREVDPAILGPLFAADVAYLETSFDSLDRDHGGVDAYLAAIGVDDVAKGRLRALLLH